MGLGLLGKLWWTGGRLQDTTLHNRGVRHLVDMADLAAHKRKAGSAALSIVGIPVCADDEVKHFKLMWATGTGKSTAIRELLAGALARGDRAVIADPDGGYLSRYHASRGDVILDPVDARSAKWHVR